MLVRSVAEDQANVLGAISEAFGRAGLDGQQCVLRAVCELEETPIKHWSILGDMVTTLLQSVHPSSNIVIE